MLIVLRGNSASGKSAIARTVRERYGRGIAIVGQDNLRRVVLREHDKPGAPNVGLIGMVARYALDAGYHVVVEGILSAAHYSDMLAGLCADHRGLTRCYYLDVPFEETLRRHQTKPPAEYGQAEMSDWYRERDFLPGGIEQIITAETSLEAAVDRIVRDTGLVPREQLARAVRPRPTAPVTAFAALSPVPASRRGFYPVMRRGKG